MAKRSRPPTLLTLAHRLVRQRGLFGRSDLVLCACSGGPDSNALLHVLALLRRRIGHRLRAVGVDHGLRSEAPAELALAAQLAAEHEVPFEIRRVELSAGSNLQARARSKRHEALQASASKHDATVIATGHTADDRAETVLLRLLGGSGPRGLAAMPARAPASSGRGADLVRPLLRARASDVRAHLERHELCFARDPSNRDKRFTRVRLRLEVLPLLEQISPSLVSHLCALAEALEEHRHGDPWASLTRTQRRQIDQVLRLGRGQTTVRVSGGRDLTVGFLRKKDVHLGKQ